MCFVKTQRVHVILAHVLNVTGRGVQPQPAGAIDIAHPQRPLSVEDVGMAVEDGHQYFVQGHLSFPFLSSRALGSVFRRGKPTSLMRTAGRIGPWSKSVPAAARLNYRDLGVLRGRPSTTPSPGHTQHARRQSRADGPCGGSPTTCSIPGRDCLRMSTKYGRLRLPYEVTGRC